MAVNLPEIDGDITKRPYDNYMGRCFEMLIDPDAVHTVNMPNKQQRKLEFPVVKTEEEIDRHWEYLRMMGRS